MKNQRFYLLVPTTIVRGEYFKLDAITFVVYCYLLHQEFQSFKKGETLEINHFKLKREIKIADNRTLKKCLNKLHQTGLIKEKIEKLPNKQYLYITLVPASSDYFTRMPIKIFEHIGEIGHVGFQLMFYYESYINRRQLKKQFAFPSFDTIKGDLEISNDTVIKYNNILIDRELLSVVKYEVDNSKRLESPLFTKWHNKYNLLIHKL